MSGYDYLQQFQVVGIFRHLREGLGHPGADRSVGACVGDVLFAIDERVVGDDAEAFENPGQILRKILERRFHAVELAFAGVTRPGDDVVHIVYRFERREGLHVAVNLPIKSGHRGVARLREVVFKCSVVVVGRHVFEEWIATITRAKGAAGGRRRVQRDHGIELGEIRTGDRATAGKPEQRASVSLIRPLRRRQPVNPRLCRPRSDAVREITDQFLLGLDEAHAE